MVILRWLYLFNAILLINHEIDSAYWKEWDLFKLKGGESGFLLLHFPLLFLILYGLVAVWLGSMAGLYLSLLLSVAGISAFFIHAYFLKQGHKEFKTPVSLFILISTLVVSFVQLVITLTVLIKG
jgi:hypothetical protein